MMEIFIPNVNKMKFTEVSYFEEDLNGVKNGEKTARKDKKTGLRVK